MERVLSSMPFLSSALSRQGATLRAEIDRASTELTTGRTRDAGLALGGDFSVLAGIDHSLSRLAGFGAVTQELDLLAGTMQTALGVVWDGAEALAADLARGGSVVSEAQRAALFAEGSRHFATAVTMLNTRLADRAVFGGTEAGQPPLPDADTLLTALEAAVAGAATVQDAVTAIDDWFGGATGYEALYAGGPARADLPVAPGETASLPVTALDPAIRQTLAGLAMAALLDRGLFAGQPEARGQAGEVTAERLLTSGEARAVLQARIGTVQAQVADARARNSAEETALGIARNGLVEIDPYHRAAELQDLQTRLESFYVITARLSRLSLTEFLR